MKTMKQHLSLIFFLGSTLVCFAGYCWALIDWTQDYRTGVYRNDHWEAFYETLALLIYTALAIRFMIKHLTLPKKDT
ncbi:hypothetical protein BH09BAC4_BH09BAC4_24510 [soil metagenome]